MAITEYKTTTEEWGYEDTTVDVSMPGRGDEWVLVHTSACSIESKYGSRGRIFWTWSRKIDASFHLYQMRKSQAIELIVGELARRGYPPNWRAVPNMRVIGFDDVLQDDRRTISECVDHLIRLVPANTWER